MENKDEYNGWVNYETWMTNMWLNENQATYGSIMNMAKIAAAGYNARSDKTTYSDAAVKLSDKLKEHYEAQMPKLNGMFGDLLTRSMQRVEWREIAQNFVTSAIEEQLTNEKE